MDGRTAHLSRRDKPLPHLSLFAALVNVTQAEGDGICFTCTCSFKLSEESHFDVQEKIDLEQQYGKVLSNKEPEDWDEVSGMDVPW